MKHLYCAVCAGSDEIGSFSAIVWSCCWWAPGHGDCPLASSRPSDQRQRRPDDRKCWAGNVVRLGDVEWLTLNEVGWECLRLMYRSRPGTPEPCTADSMHCNCSQLVVDTFWLMVWKDLSRCFLQVNRPNDWQLLLGQHVDLLTKAIFFCLLLFML